MNDYVAMIWHHDRTAQWRREADDWRLIAEARRTTAAEAAPSRRSRRRRALVIVASSLLLLVSLAQRVAGASPTCADIEPLDVLVHGEHVVRSAPG